LKQETEETLEAAEHRVMPGDGQAGTRALVGTPLGLLYMGLGVLIALFHLWANVFGTLSSQVLSSAHFAGFALLCCLRYPLIKSEGARRSKALVGLDIVIGLLVAGCAVGIVASENAIYDRGQNLTTLEWVMAWVTIIGAIEFARRTTGWVIPILIVLSLSYLAWWGAEIDGIFKIRTLSLESITFRSIFLDDAMFGNIGRISASFVFMFILFGAFLVRSGAGEFIINLGRAVAGSVTGGPGFVAIFSSGLTGTISGSAVANTVSTGVMTIPLMKRSGFPPKFAAGVEAASSTGGQLMPPIMGAGAFVMANYTQIPYLDIVAVSFLPALAYFLSVAFFVRIEAKRSKVTVSDEERLRVMQVLRDGGIAFLLPLGVLITLLIMQFTPVYAAGWACLSVVAASWLTRNPMGPRAILEALALGAHNMVMTAMLLIAVGLMINVITTTGTGNVFSLMIGEWSGGNLLIAILLVALASLVLGMGLPVTAAYIVLATLSAPALQTLIVNNLVDIDGQLIQDMANGTLAETIKPFFMLADPAAMTKLAAPMPFAEAQALYDSLSGPLLDQVRQQAEAAIDPAILTGALLSAHMIVFWLSQDSNVTPPVCLTAFAAAAIAKTPPMATGFVAWKLAKGLYIMPILFGYTAFLTGDVWQVLLIFGVALLGIMALGGALEGHLERPIGWPLRILLVGAGIALLWPNTPLLEAAGAITVLGLLFWQVRLERRISA